MVRSQYTMLGIHSVMWDVYTVLICLINFVVNFRTATRDIRGVLGILHTVMLCVWCVQWRCCSVMGPSWCYVGHVITIYMETDIIYNYHNTKCNFCM